MKVLVTGSSGMVGRNILDHNKAHDHNVLSPSSNELNLLLYENVIQYLNKHKPDIIIHCAGKVGGIQANLREPVKFLLDNLDMGRNLVWAAYQAGITRLINLGSSCMYPRNTQNPLREDDILKGELEPTNEGYAIAKVATAKLCDYIHKEYPTYSYKTMIPCNLYGKWDKFDPDASHLIPAVIRKVYIAKQLNESSVEIWGDGQARREFMYAADLADCIWHGVENFESLPFLMNVGLGYDFSINEYYEAAAKIIGFEGGFIHNLDKPVGMKQKLVDITKQTAWGWRPATTLSDGITRTFEHFLMREERK
ncbi:GDP-L-fucose synthase family protein [Paenibacillus sp. HJGM_3]